MALTYLQLKQAAPRDRKSDVKSTSSNAKQSLKIQIGIEPDPKTFSIAGDLTTFARPLLTTCGTQPLAGDLTLTGHSSSGRLFRIH